MAKRSVYMISEKAPFLMTAPVEFEFHPGFSTAQKQRNIDEIHRKFRALRPAARVLEISSKSRDTLGVQLSAFHLQKFVPSLDRSVPVENAFQAGKVFAAGGPYPDLLDVSPRDAKRDERLKTAGRLTAFTFEGRTYPIRPETAFYNWLYLNALLENEALAEQLLEYDAFTDIEFNPERSINCQAKAAAVYVSMARQGLLNEIPDFDRFLAAVAPGRPTEPVKEEAEPRPAIEAGDTVIHKLWGEGLVKEAGSSLTVHFESRGDVKMGLQWVQDNCEIRHK